MLGPVSAVEISYLQVFGSLAGGSDKTPKIYG